MRNRLLAGMILSFPLTASMSPALADYSCTTTTPRGTTVSAICVTTELTASQIAQRNSYVDAAYPSATRETNASRKYNCHSYAWYSQSTSNYRWINTPQDDKYWTDGSYRRVACTACIHTPPSSAPNGSKVSYVYSDHSAIKVSSTHFRSKWGDYPRMYHPWSYSPYNDSYLNFYVRN